MKAWLACLLAIGTAASALAEPSLPPTERELHMARCVAALDAQTRDLAQKVKAGDETLRPLLSARMEAGVAFVGDAYMNGNRDEARARGLAEQSGEQQKSLSAAERAELQTACAEEGEKLLADGSGLERFIVRRMARKRVGKLLE